MFLFDGMGNVTLELSESEMACLAEMVAFSITMQGFSKDATRAQEVSCWRRIASKVMEQARHVPLLQEKMECNHALKHWFFTDAHMRDAYYSSLMDDVIESLFWSELVERMADNTLSRMLSPEEYESLPEPERMNRVAALEQAIWNEVERYGLEHLLFVIPDC